MSVGYPPPFVGPIEFYRDRRSRPSRSAEHLAKLERKLIRAFRLFVSALATCGVSLEPGAEPARIEALARRLSPAGRQPGDNVPSRVGRAAVGFLKAGEALRAASEGRP